MIDLPAYFRREAAQYRLLSIMSAKRAKDAAGRSDSTAKGNRTRAARRAGA